MSFKATLLLFCEVLAALSPLSNITPLSAGTTVRVCVPSGIPVKETPKVYVFSLFEILVGVVLARVAGPPVIDKVKSLASKAPVAPIAL